MKNNNVLLILENVIHVIYYKRFIDHTHEFLLCVTLQSESHCQEITFQDQSRKPTAELRNRLTLHKHLK